MNAPLQAIDAHRSQVPWDCERNSSGLTFVIRRHIDAHGARSLRRRKGHDDHDSLSCPRASVNLIAADDYCRAALLDLVADGGVQSDEPHLALTGFAIRA